MAGVPASSRGVQAGGTITGELTIDPATAPATASLVVNGRAGASAGTFLLYMQDSSTDTDNVFTVNRDGTTQIVDSNPSSAVVGSMVKVLAGGSRAPLQVGSWSAQSLFVVGDGGSVAINPSGSLGLILKGPHAAPANGDIAAGEVALWFDQTDGAAKLKIKAKSANGTVVTGEVALA
jgi:hypothetical protein